jgi:hypothetical protein
MLLNMLELVQTLSGARETSAERDRLRLIRDALVADLGAAAAIDVTVLALSTNLFRPQFRVSLPNTRALLSIITGTMPGEYAELMGHGITTPLYTQADAPRTNTDTAKPLLNVKVVMSRAALCAEVLRVAALARFGSVPSVGNPPKTRESMTPDQVEGVMEFHS